MPTGALDITLYRDDLMRHAVGPQPLVSLLLHGYALLLPLHMLDVLHTAWRGRFRSELYEMAGRVERFREPV